VVYELVMLTSSGFTIMHLPARNSFMDRNQELNGRILYL